MARIRTVKPSFFRHRQLFLAEKESGLPLRLAFEGLWTVADRDGRFKWEPEEHKLDCLPYDDVDFGKVMDALCEHGFITKYEVGGRHYGVIPSFTDHQVINNREAASKLPPQPAKSDNDASATREPRVSVLHEGKGKEGKGRESDARAIDLRVSIVQLFEEFGLQPPDTSQVHLWIAQQFEPEICLAVVRKKLSHRRKPFSLGYCDEAIKEAHQNRAPPAKPKPEIDWDTLCRVYAESKIWPRYQHGIPLGPEPTYGGCRAPPDILKKYGFECAA